VEREKKKIPFFCFRALNGDMEESDQSGLFFWGKTNETI
jgi:hypothetical protein